MRLSWATSSAVERPVHIREVTGSTPVSPTFRRRLATPCRRAAAKRRCQTRTHVLDCLVASGGGGGRLCTRCGVVRAEDEFPFRSAASGTRRSPCRFCCRDVSRRHYRQKRSAYLERNRRNNPRLLQLAKQHVYEFLLEHPCMSCGERDPVVLEFNHRDPASKTSNIADLMLRMASSTRLDAEIAKCDVLCANCHQRVTSLARSACVDCGVNDPLVLQFDHRERKANHVSGLWAVAAARGA
jgi:hypothetical protein